jgi:hypothetical protein
VTRNPVKTLFFLCLLAMLTMQQVSAQDTAIERTYSINIKPTTDFDQRFYYVPGERQNVWGYRVGILINDKYKLGIGGYYMNQHTDQGVATAPLTRTSSDPVTVNKQLFLGTVYYEPYLLRRNLWETSLVFETGYGRTVNASISKTDNSALDVQKAILIPAGIGLSVNLKLPALFHIQCFRWVGINAMAGYRAVLYQQDKRYNYNGAYWSLSGAIFLDRIFEDFHTWKKQRAAARDFRIIQLSW